MQNYYKGYLLKSKDYQSDYGSLIKSIWPNKEDSKINRMELSQVLKSVKKTLGILPKNKTSNSDIFKNIKGFGYRILTE